MITVEGLNKFGADTEEGLARCMGSEGLYLRLVNMVPDEEGFEKLKAAVDAGDDAGTNMGRLASVATQRHRNIRTKIASLAAEEADESDE